MEPEGPDSEKCPWADGVDPGPADDTTESGALTLAALKGKKGKKGMAASSGKDEAALVGNEELKALEAHILRLSKQGKLDDTISLV